MRHLALAVFVLTAAVIAQVEHAPTVAQCQADERLWSYSVSVNPNSQTFPVLQRWSREMSQCKKVDPINVEDYSLTGTMIQLTQANRMIAFIKRHDLYRKFIEEDAAGKR